MYVCMFEALLRVCMYVRSPSWAGIYVCMYDWEHLHYICMYVSGDKRCMYVCLKHTYIQSEKEASLPKRSSLSMYVCLKTLCLSWKMEAKHSNIHAQRSLKSFKKGPCDSSWTCMYVSKPSACPGKWNLNTQTYTLLFTQKSYLRSLLRVYVCLKSLCLSWKNAQTSTFLTPPFLYKHL